MAVWRLAPRPYGCYADAMEKGAAFARLAIVAAASFLLSGAAPRLESEPARDLYIRMVWLWVDAWRCKPSEIATSVAREESRLNKRMRLVWPWLEATVGAGELERIQAEFANTMHGTVFSGCVSDYRGMRARSDYRAIVAEFERRAKRSRERR